MNENLNIFLSTLKGELFLKERELETLLNNGFYDYDKLKQVILECNNLNGSVALIQKYFSIDNNNNK
jgi:hypothetical protein